MDRESRLRAHARTVAMNVRKGEECAWMALLVHLTQEKNAKSIVCTGIKKGRVGVFCLRK